MKILAWKRDEWIITRHSRTERARVFFGDGSSSTNFLELLLCPFLRRAAIEVEDASLSSLLRFWLEFNLDLIDLSASSSSESSSESRDFFWADLADAVEVLLVLIRTPRIKNVIEMNILVNAEGAFQKKKERKRNWLFRFDTNVVFEFISLQEFVCTYKIAFRFPSVLVRSIVLPAHFITHPTTLALWWWRKRKQKSRSRGKEHAGQLCHMTEMKRVVMTMKLCRKQTLIRCCLISVTSNCTSASSSESDPSSAVPTSGSVTLLASSLTVLVWEAGLWLILLFFDDLTGPVSDPSSEDSTTSLSCVGFDLRP